MNLKSIEIFNYRSIKKLKINPEKIADKNCSILLGINEAGKSNILKAISYLDESTKSIYELDCNKEAYKKGESIVFNFNFTLENTSKLKKIIKNLDILDNLKNKLELVSVTKKVEIDSKNKKISNYWLTFNDELIDYSIYYSDGDSIKKYLDLSVRLGDKDDIYIDENNVEWKKLTSKLLDEVIWDKFSKYFKSIEPKVTFWKSNEDEYLINKPIPLDSFILDNSISIPLKNLFALCNLKNDELKSYLPKIKNNIEERLELQEMLSESGTNHLNTLWPEMKINLKVQIETDGLCSVLVEDKDNSKPKFNMSQRSDGFKQFVSILLSLSAENKTNILSNTIILLDEPEISLHPSSVKYLRDELFNIAKNNYVFISSHSTYMVDKLNLNRHYKIFKEKSNTFIEQIDSNNPLQEEVIYEALGTSIYEIIEPNMVIFEGSLDSSLFNLFTNKFKAEILPLNIRSIFASGTKQIPKYTKFFNQKLVKGFIVVDSDKDGKSAKIEVLKDDTFQNKVFELKDFIETEKNELVLEDLIPRDLILDLAVIKYGISFDSIDSNKLILEEIKKIKISNSIHIDGKLEELKKEIFKIIVEDFNLLTKDKLKEKYSLYFTFLLNLHQKIKDEN